MSVRTYLLLVVVAAVCSSSSIALATAHQPRIHPSVHRQLRAQGTVNLIVTFKDSTKSVLESANEAEFASRGTKISNLVERLENHASTSQASLS